MGCKICKYKQEDEENEIIRSSRPEKKTKLSTSKLDILEYKNEILTLINKYRKEHNSPPLKENTEISKIAQIHSENISNKGKIYLSNNTYKGEKLGESIFGASKLYKPKDLVEKWYNTESEHTYGSEETKATNFAQMIWKSSTDFGLGFCKRNNENYYYIVANYFPPGNVTGQFCNNVFPKNNELEIINNDFLDNNIKVLNGKNLNSSNLKSMNNLNKNSLDNNNDIDMEKFRKDALETHNKFRKIHHSEDLILNDDLNQLALNYAIKLSSLGNLKHSIDKYNGIELGENLYYCKGSDINGVKMTEKWYEEVNNYDFNSNKFISGTGHFTQVVWKDTKECGFGFAKSNDGAFYAVGKYYPSGNYQGKYIECVLPK